MSLMSRIPRSIPLLVFALAVLVFSLHAPSAVRAGLDGGGGGVDPFLIPPASIIIFDSNDGSMHSFINPDAFLNGGLSYSLSNSSAIFHGTDSSPSPQAQRTCFLMDPTAYPSSWNTRSFKSPGNNHVLKWTGSIWIRQGAGGGNNNKYSWLQCSTTALPDASLTANGSSSDITVAAGDPVSLEWNSRWGQIRKGTCTGTNFSTTGVVPGHWDEVAILEPCYDDGTWAASLFAIGMCPIGYRTVWVPDRTYDRPFGGVNTVHPNQTTTYTYTCSNALGATSASVTVNVEGVSEECGVGGNPPCDPNDPGGGGENPAADSDLPDLTASKVLPERATPNEPTTFASIITNGGGGAVPTAFTNLFQFDDNDDHKVVTATRLGTSPALASGEFDESQVSFTFPTDGTWYVRACADADASWNGTVAEFDEENNCSEGGWTSIAVGIPAECEDGRDNDGDELIDYPPGDPGCFSSDDNDETDLPVCNNNRDDDRDGYVDMADPGCREPEDDDEYHPIAGLTFTMASALVQPGATQTLTWGAVNVQDDSCTVRGTNGDISSLSGSGGTITTRAINAQATYTLTCLNLTGQSISSSVIVRINPSHGEE